MILSLEARLVSSSGLGVTVAEQQQHLVLEEDLEQCSGAPGRQILLSLSQILLSLSLPRSGAMDGPG